MKTLRPVLRSVARVSFAALLTLDAGLAADNQPPPGYEALFNGKDLTGWTVPAGDNGHWKVVNGVIDYDARSEASGDKNLWSEREFDDYILQLEWRIKETTFINPAVRYVLPDGSNARDTQGKEIMLTLPDSDSGVLLRPAGKKVEWYYQVNIWCWPIGSGEMYGPRTDRNSSPELRAAVTPRTQADKPVGEWNCFEITVRGNTVSVVLNGKIVLPGATIPDLPSRGRLALQHHGVESEGKWVVSPSLLQFKNIYIKELNAIPANDDAKARSTAEGRILALSGNGPWLRNSSLRALKALPELRVIRMDHNGFVGNDPRIPEFDGSGFDALTDSKLADIAIGLSFSDKGMEQCAKIKSPPPHSFYAATKPASSLAALIPWTAARSRCGERCQKSSLHSFPLQRPT